MIKRISLQANIAFFYRPLMRLCQRRNVYCDLFHVTNAKTEQFEQAFRYCDSGSKALTGEEKNANTLWSVPLVAIAIASY
jgi:hypothetical protein